jgi:hypothetical protein
MGEGEVAWDAKLGSGPLHCRTSEVFSGRSSVLRIVILFSLEDPSSLLLPGIILPFR